MSAFVIKTGSTTQWQADLVPKEMATSDMRNRRHVQPLLTWSTNAAHPCIPGALTGHLKELESRFELGIAAGFAITSAVSFSPMWDPLTNYKLTCVCVQVYTEGRLILEFTFDDLMRIKSWHFATRQHRELVPRSFIALQVGISPSYPVSLYLVSIEYPLKCFLHHSSIHLSPDLHAKGEWNSHPGSLIRPLSHHYTSYILRKKASPYRAIESY
ncbi:LDB2 [Cordylochernes scorpioides]|uniref:LDB2 n=1 Tax=Cordylochernes scorpioides TaxID=51811 RepID=A0ABY6JYA4_9ARAC|nr:LDB2 [Cordylochernes scorpioides]